MTHLRWLPVAASILPAAAPAQTVPLPSPTPSAIPVPAAPVGLPTATPSPALPVVAPSATPTPAPRPTPRAEPLPRATPSPRATRSPQPVASATPAASPSAVPAPTVTASPELERPAAPSPQPVATPPSPAAPAGNGIPAWLIVLAVAILAAIGGLIALRRRSTSVADDVAEEAPGDTTATPQAAPAVMPPPPPMPVRPVARSDEAASSSSDETRPPLVIEFRPIRAGLNLLSATVESEVVITNPGQVAAEDVRVEVRLIGAHAGQDADLAAIAREPVSRPAVAPFALQPGEVARLSAVAALPRAAIVPPDAGGRPIFVPIVTVKLDCAMGTASVRQAAAYAVGVERVDSARLAPFRLDGPPRTFDTVAARVHPIA